MNNKNIKAALSVAATALLTTSSAGATSIPVDLDDDNAWSFDSAFLYYSEADRVSAAEAIIKANKTFQDDSILNLQLTVDTLTGASANGALAQPNVQTFTRPSGKGNYDVKAGDTPLDDTFRDTRLQLNVQWTQPLRPNYIGSAGMHISKEYDYLSLGVNSNISYDFNKKNSTFSFGLSYFQDTFTPEGGIPKAFTSMPAAFHKGDDSAHDATRISKDDSKSTADIMLGFTQVINRRMVTQFNYSYSLVNGYLTDPFKMLSLINAQGIAQDYLYEHRPDKRVKQSIFAQTKYHFDKIILDMSYRYMWDDWQINSHTIDTRFYIPLAKGHYLEPHLRFYQQSAAQFYQPFLFQDEALAEYASADYRIGEMTAYTLGLKYGLKLSSGNDLSFRLEYYRQNPKGTETKIPDAIADMELYESIDAIIAQVSYSF